MATGESPISSSEVIRQGYLGKKSGNLKNRFGVSFNLRWFCLTPTTLSYHHNDKEKGREKGRIPLHCVKWIEKADLGGEPPPNVESPLTSCLNLNSQYNHNQSAFQVVFSVENKTRTLHLQAIDESDRDLWIESIKLCLDGSSKRNSNSSSQGTTETTSLTGKQSPSHQIQPTTNIKLPTNGSPFVDNLLNSNSTSPLQNPSLITGGVQFQLNVNHNSQSGVVALGGHSQQPPIPPPKRTQFQSHNQPHQHIPSPQGQLYHRGVWSLAAGKWTCCGVSDRDCLGCEPLVLSPSGTSVFHSPSSSSSSNSSSSPTSINSITTTNNINSQPSSLTPISNNNNGHHINTNFHIKQGSSCSNSSPPKTASIVSTHLASRAPSATNRSPSINHLNSINNSNNNNGIGPTLSLKSVSHHNLLTSGGQPASLVHSGPLVGTDGGSINVSNNNGAAGVIGLPNLLNSHFVPLEKPQLQQPLLNLNSISAINNNHSVATTPSPATTATLIANGFMSSPEMGGGNPGTPLNKPRDKSATPRRVVVALYPFKAIEAGDLSLEKSEEYEIMDDSQEHWWQVRDKNGAVGYIPSNYVKEKELLGLQKYDWYVGDMSRQRAETLLRYDDKEGCFVVRNSSTKGLYTLSLYTKVPHPQVKHYHIKQNTRSEFYLSEKHCCISIPELINYHRHNSGGLASRLKHPPSAERCAPATAGLSHDKWEIDPSELMLHEELGSGQFGVVRRGKWRGCIDVAVKMMKEGTMSEDDFIEEAKVMTKLQHQNLVQLYGVCSKHRPIYIVTEYMKHGALLNYLRRHETTLTTNLDMMVDMCIQVCKGMAYLERHNYIHRDLAARNCLVGADNVVKVADFGLARYVLDDQYTSSGGTKFPIKWAPPEVLNYTRFSSKSDVWAYGVLVWEVFTCGKMPYGRLKNTEVVERVQRGIVLEKPKNCPKEVYETMKKCWALHPDERPSFRVLKEQLQAVSQLLLAD